MSTSVINIEQAILDGVIHPQDTRRLSADYGKVTSFIELKGRPSRPIDDEWRPREAVQFEKVRSYLPRDFFDPFDLLLKLVGQRLLT